MDFFSSKYNENYLDKFAYKGLLDFFLQLILKPSLSTLGYLHANSYSNLTLDIIQDWNHHKL